MAQRGIELELRHALEPWHVLGEEPGGGGTVRYVDSSVERLQVKAVGLNERAPRHRLQRLAPAAARHRHGRRIRRGRALSRLAAGQLRCIRPSASTRRSPSTSTIRWNGRSLGGCSYHVAHPGGRNYDRMPVNANEAEARRRARFFPIGHSPGDMPEPRPIDNPEHPLTLDLRRA